jgi:hypothetical protein
LIENPVDIDKFLEAAIPLVSEREIERVWENEYDSGSIVIPVELRFSDLGWSLVKDSINTSGTTSLVTTILSGGGVQSQVIPELQIIPNELFDRAQEILSERSTDYNDRRVPLNTRGSALLAGNIFCGHCDGRLTITTNGKKYFRKDGDVTITPRTRYVCYNKTRHPERCSGQTGYTVSKLDGVVEKVLESVFAKIKEQPGEQIITAQYNEHIAACKLNLEQAQAALGSELKTLSTLEGELIKVIQGTSKIKPEMLNKKHDEAERSVAQKRVAVEKFQQELDNNQEMMKSVKRQYNEILSWADMFTTSPMEVKKMIVAQLMSAVRVSRDYEIEIDFKISERQLGLEKGTALEPKRKSKDEMTL